VIFALGVNCANPNETRHVPFRDSKLTLLLRTSLNPANCRTVMVMNVSPDNQQFMETVSTLKFAQRVKQIKAKEGVDDRFKAEESGEVDVLRKEIGRLKMQLDGVNSALPPPSQATVATSKYLESTIPRVERMEAITRTLVPTYHRRIMEDKLIDRLKTEKIARLERKINGGLQEDDPDSDFNVLCSEIDSLRRLLNEPDPEAVMYKTMYEDLVKSQTPLVLSDEDELNRLKNLTVALLQEKDNLGSDLEVAKKKAREAQTRAQDSTAATKKLLERRLKEAEERAEASDEIREKLESLIIKYEDSNSQLKSKMNTTSAQADKVQHEYQNLSLLADAQKKEVAKLTTSLAATQSELKEKAKDFSKMQREHEAEMEGLQNELFMESERMTEEKGATEIEMKGQLAAAFKDNAILQQRVKGLISERENYDKEAKLASSKISELEGEISDVKAAADQQSQQIEAAHKERLEKLEKDNMSAYENSDKWERAADENDRKVSSLMDEVKRLKKKRDDDAFELENLQEDMDTMTENVRFLQQQNEELQAYNVRLEEINNMGGERFQLQEDDEEEEEHEVEAAVERKVEQGQDDEAKNGEILLTEERAKQILEEAKLDFEMNDEFNESAFLPPPNETDDVFDEDIDDDMFFESQVDAMNASQSRDLSHSRDEENEIPFSTPLTTGKVLEKSSSKKALSGRRALAQHNE